jgi:hypothetical protein
VSDTEQREPSQQPLAGRLLAEVSLELAWKLAVFFKVSVEVFI